jgi:hypothetical protein
MRRTLVVAGPDATYRRGEMAKTPPLSKYEALDLLKEHGIVNKDMTWEKIEEISKTLALNNDGPVALAWYFVVKDKMVLTGFT